MPELVIVGDEAWLPEEWEAEQRRRRRPSTAAKKARDREYQRRYRATHREELNAYKREWMRRLRKANPKAWRPEGPKLVGTLHTLACSGPTVIEGCVCGKRGTRKIRVYDRPVKR